MTVRLIFLPPSSTPPQDREAFRALDVPRETQTLKGWPGTPYADSGHAARHFPVEKNQFHDALKIPKVFESSILGTRRPFRHPTLNEMARNSVFRFRACSRTLMSFFEFFNIFKSFTDTSEKNREAYELGEGLLVFFSVLVLEI